MLPLHEIVRNLGPDKSKVLIKAHIMTGEDIMSKVGTKPLARTFDALRHEKYLGGNSGIDDLPPTSYAIGTHIHRGAYLVYSACSILNSNSITLYPG